MREIKFRAWDCDNEMMSYTGLSFNNIEDFRHALDGFEDYFGKGYFKDSPNYLMQYTGLKDKNGKEIYEGDIVEYNKTMWNDDQRIKKEVVFKDGCFVLKESTSLYVVCSPDFNVEIMGNIHENKDLL